jgi:hypothetical protein
MAPVYGDETKGNTMSEDAPKAVAGWYPTPEGSQRYWDGDQWLNVPAPESSSQTDVGSAEASLSPVKKSRRRSMIVAAVVIAVLVIGGGSALVWKSVSDQQAAIAAEQAADEAAAAESAEKARRAASLAAAAEADAEAERKIRAEAVPGIEDSIRVMAEGHIADDLIDGPVLSVDCSPVDGGSTDDLTDQTTVFACFVANFDNGDGTQNGYNYNATMNWTTGGYTYGMGAP